MFEKFIEVLRDSVGIPEDISIDNYLETLGIPDDYPEFMRVEVTWDGWYSSWSMSIRFDTQGRIVDEVINFSAHCEPDTRDKVLRIFHFTPKDNVDVATEFAFARLKALAKDDEFDVVWEWHKPTFVGNFDASWDDLSWQDAKILTS